MKTDIPLVWQGILKVLVKFLQCTCKWDQDNCTGWMCEWCILFDAQDSGGH